MIAEQLQVRVERQRPKSRVAGTGEVFVAPWSVLLGRVRSGGAVELPARFVPRDAWPRRTGPDDRLRLTAEDRIEHA